MAIVGAMTLARRGGLVSGDARVVPGSQVLASSDVDLLASHEHPTAIETHSTDEAARLLELPLVRKETERE